MKLFDIFRTKEPEVRQEITGPLAEKPQKPPLSAEASQITEPIPEKPDPTVAPEIPEDVFIEKEIPKSKEKMETPETTVTENNLQTLYAYLGRNLEKKGYEDSLMNPDTSYMEEHVRYIKNDLALLIARVKNYYSTHLRDVEHHIDTRKRNGLVETVDELLTHKANMQEEMQLVVDIEEDAREGKGLTENLILGYTRGFRNGFAAITYSTILGKRNR